MKAVFISYSKSLTERIDFMLGRLSIRGYTKWETVHGQGTVDGDPHLGSHIWPAANSSILTIITEEKAQELLAQLKKLNEQAKEEGLRAFVWNIEDGI